MSVNYAVDGSSTGIAMCKIAPAIQTPRLPLMAQSGSATGVSRLPLSGVKQTSKWQPMRSVRDPQETWRDLQNNDRETKFGSLKPNLDPGSKVV